MNSAKLSERILDCLNIYDTARREKEETSIYNEVSQIYSNVIRAIIVRLCEKIEELEYSKKQENLGIQKPGGRLISKMHYRKLEFLQQKKISMHFRKSRNRFRNTSLHITCYLVKDSDVNLGR